MQNPEPDRRRKGSHPDSTGPQDPADISRIERIEDNSLFINLQLNQELGLNDKRSDSGKGHQIIDKNGKWSPSEEYRGRHRHQRISSQQISPTSRKRKIVNLSSRRTKNTDSSKRQGKSKLKLKLRIKGRYMEDSKSILEMSNPSKSSSTLGLGKNRGKRVSNLSGKAMAMQGSKVRFFMSYNVSHF